MPPNHVARPPSRPPDRLLVLGRGVAAVLVAAIVVWVGPAALPSLTGASGCAAAASTDHAGLVVDFGTVTGAGTPPNQTIQATCVAFSADPETGSQLLADAGHTLSFNKVGLLCRIDGYPASGCTQGSDGVYRYWSYWHGGRKWTYASTGPDFYYVSPGGVDGWRFVAGADSADEPPPEAPPTGPCPPRTTTTAPGPPATASDPGIAPSAAGAGSGPSASGSSAGRSPTTTVSGSTPTRPAAHPAAPGPAAAGAPTTTVAGRAASVHVAAGPDRPRAHDHGSALPSLLIGGLIVLLGGAALVISRARVVP